MKASIMITEKLVQIQKIAAKEVKARLPMSLVLQNRMNRWTTRFKQYLMLAFILLINK